MTFLKLRRRILIVDDDAPYAAVLKTQLDKEGYDAEVETDSQQGLARALEGRFDLIILDIMMPGADGYQVCEQLRMNRVTFAVPVIFVTAKRDPGDLLKGFFSGAHEYLTKPIKSKDLLEKVKALVG